jgi:hypothetical protein
MAESVPSRWYFPCIPTMIDGERQCGASAGKDHAAQTAMYCAMTVGDDRVVAMRNENVMSQY